MRIPWVGGVMDIHQPGTGGWGKLIELRDGTSFGLTEFAICRGNGLGEF